MIRRHFVAGALYGDALPDGEFVALMPTQGLETHRGFVNLPKEEVEADEKSLGVLFPRLNPLDGTSFAGPSHQDLGTWVRQSGQWKLREGSCGTSPVIFDHAGELHISHCGPVGSQGYRYVAEDGRLVTGDETYADPSRQIWEFTTLGGVTVGQDGTANKSVLLYNNRRYELTDFEGRFIRLTLKGSKLAITICQFGHGVHFLWLDIADIPELKVIVSPDVIVLPPPKPQEPKPMEAVRLPERVQQIVEALYERNLRLAHSNNDDDRRILTRMIAEQTCFELGDEWGWKSNHGIGISPAKDAIAKRLGPVRLNERQPLLIWDLFNGSTRKPNERPFSEPEHESSQFFIPVEPVNHLAVAPKPQEPTVPVPNPGPIVPNSGTVVVDVNPALAPLKAEIAALKAQLADLKETIQQLEADMPQATPEVKLPRRIALRSVANGKLVCADFDKGPDGALNANRSVLSSWETFEFIVVE